MVKYNLFFFPSEDQWITKLSESCSREGADTDLGVPGNAGNAAARQRHGFLFCNHHAARVGVRRA